VVEAVKVDAQGHEHQIVEKVSVLTRVPITVDSELPVQLWLQGEGRSVEGTSVAVCLGRGIQTVEGEETLVLDAGSLKWQ